MYVCEWVCVCEGQWVSSYFTTLKFWWKGQNLNLNHLFCPQGKEPAMKDPLGSEHKEEAGGDRKRVGGESHAKL